MSRGYWCPEHVEDWRPILIDWYACEGGAGRGYERAGFRVVSVDRFDEYRQQRNPFASWKGDALLGMAMLLAGELLPLSCGCRLAIEDVAAHHASPPCQHASAGTRTLRKRGDRRHPALIEATRELLRLTGQPYVIENVKGAALHDPVTLCWSQFYDEHEQDIRNEDGVLLRMERHRLFEATFPIDQPRPCRHDKSVQVAGAYGAAQRTIAGAKQRRGGYVPHRDLQARLLGVDGMTERGMHQCLPPVYTEHIGRAILAHVEQAAAA